MATHNHLHRRHARGALDQIDKRDFSTIYEVVYTTAAATFPGEIGGYTTLGVAITADQSTPTPTPEAEPASSTPVVVQPKSSAASSSARTTLASSVSKLPSSIAYSSTALPSSLAIVAASGKVSSTAASTKSTDVSGTAASIASASATSTPTQTSAASSSSSSSGMSTAGKAGLAIGILLLLGAILSILLICFKKKRKAAEHRRLQDEKHEFANIDRHVSTRTTATAATAPRLSLRPVTQFLPNLMVKRSSRGNDLLTVTENGKVWDMDRPGTASSQSNNAENPFGNHAETTTSNHYAGTNPFGNHAEAVSPVSPIDAANANGPPVLHDMSTSEALVGGGAVGAAAIAPGLKRGVSKRGNAPSQMDFTKSGPFMGLPSPAGTEFSMSSEAGNSPHQLDTGAAIAAAGGPASSAVHRVQLDFKPSMDDELELRAGQLIRLLHEYDDGWALCIRLDRSRQGVVPRTCLSTRPVKPRPQQNGPRGGPPSVRGAQAGPPRPLTPTGPLPSTPIGRSRSPTVGQSQSSSNSPPGLSHMNSSYNEDPSSSHHYSQAPLERKPVPGQAL